MLSHEDRSGDFDGSAVESEGRSPKILLAGAEAYLELLCDLSDKPYCV